MKFEDSILIFDSTESWFFLNNNIISPFKFLFDSKVDTAIRIWVDSKNPIGI